MMSDETVDLWAIDEVHFQQYGSRCRMWVPPETKDPVLLHHPGRKSVGYFGAVRIRDGTFVYRRERDRFNALTFHDFMRHLQPLCTASDRRAVLIIDNAKYHHAKLHADWRVEHHARFCLDYLPPYSPDLNPIERVWKLTRRNGLHNRYFHSLHQIEDAVEEQFGMWRNSNDILRRLCAIN